jgi:hypothetical protein
MRTNETGRPRLVAVGGFLGAGKTTLIAAAARELTRRGVRCAAVVNDQGEALVDGATLRAGGLDTSEVTGGCFCCRFTDMMDAVEGLRMHQPEVIFLEPVGSCTDLWATVMRPLRQEFAGLFRPGPLSVVVDPRRARALLGEGADEDMAFLFRKQLEEADLIVVTHGDTGEECPELGAARVRRVSGRTGEGVAAWLDEVLGEFDGSGGRRLEIDYERYARAEAALVWLNLEARVECRPGLEPVRVLGPLVEEMEAGLRAAGVGIVHLKAADSCESGYLKAALRGYGEEPEVEGDLTASPAGRHELLVNLRATGEPESVREVVGRAVGRLPGRVSGLKVACFRPGAPRPEKGRG